ncbi:MAG: hypothetical protein Ta2B_03190 [Termitinemataceae bacterium]|nr:MAG: hypothetical protein Ta2B_03190 [Termitinemataceae bacterium]
MKKLFVVMIVVCFTFACVSIKWDNIAAFNRYKRGEFSGTSEGYGGEINVRVTTDQTSILNIEVTQQHEDVFSGAEAIRELSEQILQTNSTDIDAVSGATVTSEAFLNAVNNALEKAKHELSEELTSDTEG